MKFFYLVFIILSVCISCKSKNEVFSLVKHSGEIDKKNLLLLEIDIVLDFLDLKGQEGISNKVIRLEKLERKGVDYYDINFSHSYVTIDEKEYGHEDFDSLFLYLKDRQYSLDAFKIYRNTLICLYDNIDLPELEFDLNKIPIRYKSKTLKEELNDTLYESHSSYFFSSSLKQKKDSLFCLSYIRNGDGHEKDLFEFSKFRKMKFKKLNFPRYR